MKRLLLTLLLVSITCTVFAQRPNNSLNINKIKISGNITDSETDEPLEYATISLVNERFPEKVQGGITDTNGNFDIDIFPGKYNITIEYIGFDKTTITGKTIQENTNLGNFKLNK